MENRTIESWFDLLDKTNSNAFVHAKSVYGKYKDDFEKVNRMEIGSEADQVLFILSVTMLVLTVEMEITKYILHQKMLASMN